MTFLVILIALLIERFFDWSHLRHWQWFNALQQYTQQTIKQPAWVVMLVTLLPIAFVIWLLQLAFAHTLYGLGEFIFQFILFLYCLGPQNLWAEVYFSVNALAHGESQQADAKLTAVSGLSDRVITAESRTVFVWHAALKRVFAVIFWFVLLGPVGAVLYRGMELSFSRWVSKDASSGVAKIINWLDWPPILVLTALFALGGHFVNVFACWRALIKTKIQDSHLWLEKCGLAAVGNHELEQSSDAMLVKLAIQLFDRALVIMLVIFAIGILAG